VIEAEPLKEPAPVYPPAVVAVATSIWHGSVAGGIAMHLALAGPMPVSAS
jgi:hypothetical protein